MHAAGASVKGSGVGSGLGFRVEDNCSLGSSRFVVQLYRSFRK